MAMIEICKAEATDAPRMALIAFAAWETGIMPLLSDGPSQRERERQRLSLAAGNVWPNSVVARLNGIVVGWCCRASRRNYIPFLFVMPDVQSHGIGAALLDRMEAMLELEGISRVRLETPADNVRAVRFYEKQGYHILSIPADARNAHDAFMSVHLEKQLHPYSGRVE